LHGLSRSAIAVTGAALSPSAQFAEIEKRRTMKL